MCVCQVDEYGGGIGGIGSKWRAGQLSRSWFSLPDCSASDELYHSSGLLNEHQQLSFDAEKSLVYQSVRCRVVHGLG